MVKKSSSEYDELNTQELFALWLEGELDAKQREHFEWLCTNNNEFAVQVEQANYLNMLNDTSAAHEVPQWDKEASYTFTDKNSRTNGFWFKFSSLSSTGLSSVAMCCSLIAILMVSTGFSVEYTNGRLSAGFNERISQAQIDEILQSKLADYQQANQALFSQYVDALQRQQLQNNSQLTEYLLTSSRQERREDFAELIKFVNQQRQDDQVFFARQLNDLQIEINQQTDYRVGTAIPSNVGSINE